LLLEVVIVGTTNGKCTRSFLLVGPWCGVMCVPGAIAEKNACPYLRGTLDKSFDVTGQRSRLIEKSTLCNSRYNTFQLPPS